MFHNSNSVPAKGGGIRRLLHTSFNKKHAETQQKHCRNTAESTRDKRSNRTQKLATLMPIARERKNLGNTSALTIGWDFQLGPWRAHAFLAR